MLKLTSDRRSQQELHGRVLAFEWSNVQGVGRVAIVRDISRQVEVERAKDAILGVVSHEMRTPLTAIIGFAELITLRSDHAMEMAGRIHASAQRLIHMVNDLLEHAQAHAGVLKIQREAVCLPSLMQSVITTMGGLASEKCLLLNTNIDPDLPETVIGDDGRLQQILVNLIGNAIKFTEQGEVCVLFEKGEAE